MKVTESKVRKKRIEYVKKKYLTDNIRLHEGRLVLLLEKDPSSNLALIEPLLGGLSQEVEVEDLSKEVCFSHVSEEQQECNKCLARIACEEARNIRYLRDADRLH